MLRAAAWALALHLAALALLGSLATRDRSAAEGSLAYQGDGGGDGDLSASAWLGVHPAELADFEVARPEEPDKNLPPLDQSNRDPRPAAPEPGLASERPAPDTGDGSGRKVEAAWRRDSSTLRARVSDGSDFYQPSREDTARDSSSPQAVRSEPLVGIGDSARTTQPEPMQAAPATELPTDADLDADRVRPPRIETRMPETPGPDDVRGEGWLDAERGRHFYDAMLGGPAKDDRSARAASGESQPGLIDYALASADGPSDGVAGRGPGAIPGPASRSIGSAPAIDGWPSPRPAPIGEIGEGASERRFAREYLEIRRRVAQVLRFPKRLALLLEQGEAIVQFMVERDGRVWGDVKLLKSAGFVEFDREAVEVVRRAGPYPHLPQRLIVRMRVPFENPIIR